MVHVVVIADIVEFDPRKKPERTQPQPGSVFYDIPNFTVKGLLALGLDLNNKKEQNGDQKQAHTPHYLRQSALFGPPQHCPDNPPIMVSDDGSSFYFLPSALSSKNLGGEISRSDISIPQEGMYFF
jgi:hypothetical protein